LNDSNYVLLMSPFRRRAPGFTYSRWDGTQQGFEFDADAAFDELTDELLYHGDVNAALRRMMHQGMRDRNGDQLAGIRELLEQLRRERQDRLERHDLGTYSTAE